MQLNETQASSERSIPVFINEEISQSYLDYVIRHFPKDRARAEAVSLGDIIEYLNSDLWATLGTIAHRHAYALEGVEEESGVSFFRFRLFDNTTNSVDLDFLEQTRLNFVPFDDSIFREEFLSKILRHMKTLKDSLPDSIFGLDWLEFIVDPKTGDLMAQRNFGETHPGLRRTVSNVTKKVNNGIA